LLFLPLGDVVSEVELREAKKSKGDLLGKLSGPQKLWRCAFAPTLKGEKFLVVFVAVESIIFKTF